jgi:hypothetical protein
VSTGIPAVDALLVLIGLVLLGLGVALMLFGWK